LACSFNGVERRETKTAAAAARSGLERKTVVDP
jgi:hypothetical protein